MGSILVKCYVPGLLKQYTLLKLLKIRERLIKKKLCLACEIKYKSGEVERFSFLYTTNKFTSQ